ncbi:MAG: CRISPR-associated endonuclease Cas1 [Desulfobacula sp.]|nr:CRISPR-associated endonuclease Cas1 [Desulfobacula sp.]
MQLVLDTNGLKISKRNNCFFLQGKKQKRIISPRKISSIAVLADVYFSSSAVLLAVDHEIPVLFFSKAGRDKGRLWSPYFGNIATLRRKQIAFYTHPAATEWCINLLRLRAKGQLSNLSKLHNTGLLAEEIFAGKKSGIRQVLLTTGALEGNPVYKVRHQIMGIEGTVSRNYWAALMEAFGEKYSFKGRTRRPATDIFNSLLNYFFGILYSRVEGAILSIGLDPYLGLLHADEYARPTLAFDMIEPFRPWAEELVMNACMDSTLIPSFFDSKNKGWFLNKAGKRIFIPRFNENMEQRCTFNGRTKLRKNHLLAFAGELAALIDKTISVDDLHDIL